MKKIYLAVMATAVFMLSACNGTSTSNQSDVDSTAVEEIVDNDLQDLLGEISANVEAGDVDALSSSIEAFNARIQALINAGNGATVKKYLDAFTSYVETNKEEISNISADVAEKAQTTVSDLATKAANLPTEIAEEAQEAAEGIVDEAVETVTQAADDAKAAAEEKANEAVEEAKQKTNEAIDAQQQKANDAINKAADDVKGKLGL